MAADVSEMSASELDKLSAKIEKRRQELIRQEALAQMEAVAKKHGVDFAEIARLHSAKLPKTPKKVTRKAAPKAAAKTTTKSKRTVAPKTVSKSVAKSASKPAMKAAPKLATKSNVVSKAKYKNPDNPKQTWSGMGRKPAWFIAHLAAGKKPEGLAA
ncbi:H-NS histone family protein [Roseobacter weihaiensis]|uniref:H-NS histone family protein n=1 Tax=Roseobacter weihaiensis TaxID=2763262 RepID=UPI001D09A557|nr:H-NS histone family protein [Roseobacter sp. H9]